MAVDPTGVIDYHRERLTGSVALVLGNEDQGISDSLLNNCDSVIRIPIRGNITSLKVGVAARARGRRRDCTILSEWNEKLCVLTIVIYAFS